MVSSHCGNTATCKACCKWVESCAISLIIALRTDVGQLAPHCETRFTFLRSSKACLRLANTFSRLDSIICAQSVVSLFASVKAFSRLGDLLTISIPPKSDSSLAHASRLVAPPVPETALALSVAYGGCLWIRVWHWRYSGFGLGLQHSRNFHTYQRLYDSYV